MSTIGTAVGKAYYKHSQILGRLWGSLMHISSEYLHTTTGSAGQHSGVVHEIFVSAEQGLPEHDHKQRMTRNAQQQAAGKTSKDTRKIIRLLNNHK